MAYVYGVEATSSTAATTTLEVSIPGGYEDGDLLIVVAQQDAGSGTFTAPVGWAPCFASAQVSQNSQRTYAWYKIASGDEPLCAIVSTLSEDFILAALVIKGADPLAPIETASFSSFLSSVSTIPLPAPSSVQSGALVVRGFGNDNAATKHKFQGENFTRLSYIIGTACVVGLGYSYADDYGVTPPASVNKAGGAGGTSFAIAIRDSVEKHSVPILKDYFVPFRHFGLFGDSLDSALVASRPPSYFASTMDGFATSTTVASFSAKQANPAPNNSGDSFTIFRTGEITSNQVIIVGAVLEFSAEFDFSDGPVAASILLDGATSTASRDLYFFFGDALGNWAAFYITPYSGLVVNDVYRPILDINSIPPAAGGNLETSRINKFGLVWRRNAGGATAATTARGFAINELGKLKPQTLVGGIGSPSVSTAQAIHDGLSSRPLQHSRFQGLSQILLRTSLTIGDGVKKTAADFRGISFEVPAPYSRDIQRRFSRLGDFALEVRFKLSPTDEVNLSGTSFSGKIPYVVAVDAASSPSANILFDGVTLSGATVLFEQSMLTVSGARFISCGSVSTLAKLLYCSFVEMRGSVIVSDPGLVEACTFRQGPLGGHAIEITQPGTFAFVGNTFEGYDLDGTADAVIYNNSGGHVVLNVSGGDAPTVRNGSGASTTINSLVTLTFAGVRAGSEIHIFDGAGALLVGVENAEPNQQISIQATGVTVRIFIASLGFENIDLQFYVPNMDTSIPVFQRIDRNYRNPA